MKNSQGFRRNQQQLTPYLSYVKWWKNLLNLMGLPTCGSWPSIAQPKKCYWHFAGKGINRTWIGDIKTCTTQIKVLRHKTRRILSPFFFHFIMDSNNATADNWIQKGKTNTYTICYTIFTEDSKDYLQRLPHAFNLSAKQANMEIISTKTKYTAN